MSKKCPECGKQNDKNNWTCSWCGSLLQNERRLLSRPDVIYTNSPFSIGTFFQDNFFLFTIIGVIGTMITLLPNLGEKIIGKEWLIAEMDYLPFHFLPLIFAVFIFAGGLLIFLIFFVLIRKIWEQRLEIDTQIPDSTTQRQIRRDDLTKRLLLSFVLFLMMVGSLYFILTIIVMIPDITVRFISIIITSVFIIIFTIYNYFSFFVDTINTIKESRDEGYDILNIIGYCFFLGIVIFFLGYIIATPISNYYLHPQDPHDVHLLTDQEVYSPKISTTIGLELYPTNSTNLKSFYPRYNRTGFRWETNYGYFLTQDTYSSRIYLLDNYTVRHSEGKVYWSYSESDIPKDRTPIQIKLLIYIADGDKWSPLTNATLNLRWTDQNFARVEDYQNHSIGYWDFFHMGKISE